MSTAKSARKNKKSAFDKAFDDAIETALEAQPEDIKVHITCRLDSDIYLELKRRAESGEGAGRYQTLMNQLLRKALFESEEAEDDFEIVMVNRRTNTGAVIGKGDSRSKLWNYIKKHRFQEADPKPRTMHRKVQVPLGKRAMKIK